MFRRLSHTLPKDPVIPTDLESLGYFLNENDQIRMIDAPEQKYQFVINRNDRVNEMYKEAMNTCIRKLIRDRLQNLGIELLHLPVDTEPTESHVPILVSKDISEKKRVIVLFGERLQDLGVFSYRVIGEQGIKVGSAIEFCTDVLHRGASSPDQDSPGIVLANPGQLLWYRDGVRAITRAEWNNLPGPSAVHEAMRVDPVRNTIPKNQTYVEHVEYIFENVLRGVCAQDASFDIIGLEYTGQVALKYLANHWDVWSSRVGGICLGSPQHTIQDLVADDSGSDAFIDFIGKRCRAYFVSDEPVETLMTGREDFGCNCYASGETLYPENIIVKAWGSMLDWFNYIRVSPAFGERKVALKDNSDPDGK